MPADPLLDRVRVIVVLGNLYAGLRSEHYAAVCASWKETAEVLARWGDQFVCEEVWVLLLWLYGARLA